MTSCGLLCRCQLFGEACCLHLQYSSLFLGHLKVKATSVHRVMTQ